MSNNEIIIQMHIKNKRVAYLNISHNNIINRIWYYLYKLDQIMLKDNVSDKAREILEEPVNGNNYLEYIKYNLSNPVNGKWKNTRFSYWFCNLCN